MNLTIYDFHKNINFFQAILQWIFSLNFGKFKNLDVSIRTYMYNLWPKLVYVFIK